MMQRSRCSWQLDMMVVNRLCKRILYPLLSTNEVVLKWHDEMGWVAFVGLSCGHYVLLSSRLEERCIQSEDWFSMKCAIFYCSVLAHHDTEICWIYCGFPREVSIGRRDMVIFTCFQCFAFL